MQWQRSLKRKGGFPADREKKLNDIGFIWLPDEHIWEIMFEKLVAYKKTHGTCHIPGKYKEDSQLKNWVATQRRFKKQGRIRADREKRLDEIGFVWNSKK